MLHKNNHCELLRLVFLFLWLVFALQTSEAKGWFFNTVDVKNGLADNYVRDISTDSEGYTWISTINGLSRYDGYRFFNYQPQKSGAHSSDVLMVRETADGTLWMICPNDIFTFNRSDLQWKLDGKEKLKQSGIEGENISAFYVDEDNTDARQFLQRSLEDEYQVLLAANGKEALKELSNNDDVSIIISDVMMPVMDGMELVRQIRNNIRFSHIPVILLTAKSSEEDIVAGLKEGVADYLTKPFSLTVLRLRIQKILEWNQQVHEQVATGIDIKPSEITVSSLDEELITHLIAEVEANMSDPTYSVVQLSSSIGMTRGTLYKKLMAIAGKSPVEFIRIIRLKRAKSFLDQGRTNISEVADKVGFSPKMLAQYFRETYGETPSEYLKNKKSKNK